MKTILATVDFSPASDNAVHYAANLCRYFGAKLVLFHAYHVPVVSFENGFVPPVIDMKTDSEEELKKLTHKLRCKYKDINIRYHVKMGLAAEVIEEAAQCKCADLIVMGIRGESGSLKKHFMGSVTTQVAKTSYIPVLIVPENSKFIKIKNVAFACDLDKTFETNSIVTKVKNYCKEFKAALEVLNVMKPGEEMSPEKAEVGNYIEEKLEITNHNTFFIYDKKVYRGLLEYIDHYDTDMIIMCPRKHSFWRDLFKKSNTERLAFRSHIPILTVH